MVVDEAANRSRGIQQHEALGQDTVKLIDKGIPARWRDMADSGSPSKQLSLLNY
jgi:hypothetical protein